MAKKAMILKQQKKQKFSTREYTRCKICGRPHSYMRKYGICRICFRELAYKGEIPGVRKASWLVSSAPRSAPFPTDRNFPAPETHPIKSGDFMGTPASAKFFGAIVPHR